MPNLLLLALLQLLAVLIGSATSQSAFTCPSSVAIAPCVCTLQGSRSLLLECTDVTSQAQFTSIFQNNFPTKRFAQLRITKSDVISSLDIDYNGVYFDSIWLVEGPFSSLAIDLSIPFPNQELAQNLRRLYLYNTKIEEFPFNTLSLYRYLDDLKILNSNIDFFPALQSSTLSKFEVTRSNISEITPDTFSQLPRLHHVDLDHNKLTSLAAGTIPLNPNAFSFSFKRNKISRIEPGAFYIPGQPPRLNRVEIDLTSNLLTTIDEEVFSSLMPYVRNLYIFGNPLKCDCRMHWLLSSPDLMAKVSTIKTPKCSNTGVPLHDVDPATLC